MKYYQNLMAWIWVSGYLNNHVGHFVQNTHFCFEILANGWTEVRVSSHRHWIMSAALCSEILTSKMKELWRTAGGFLPCPNWLIPPSPHPSPFPVSVFYTCKLRTLYFLASVNCNFMNTVTLQSLYFTHVNCNLCVLHLYSADCILHM